MPLRPRSIDRVLRLSGPMLIAVVGSWILAWSWPYGPDVLIDFGRELYVPWRITEGDVLYVHLLYLNGPVSPYWNAMLFHVFGVGLRTLMTANAVLAALLTAILYALFTVAANRLAATAACLAFVSFMAFTQLNDIGNYDYLTPYSHEITHGLFLGLLALFAFAQRKRFGARVFVVSGFLWGLVFLTKIEIFLALSAALGAGLLGALWAERRSLRSSCFVLGSFLAAGLVPVLIAFLLMLLAMSPSVALGGIFNQWVMAFRPEIVSSPFYQWVRGTDRLLANLELMGLWALRYAIFALPLALISLGTRARKRWRWMIALGVFVAVYVTTGPGPDLSWPAHGILPGAPSVRISEWPDAVRILPLILLLLGLCVFAGFRRARREQHATEVFVLRLVLIVFAFALLAKIFFKVSLAHYGFALAMPGTLVLIAALVSWIPEWIDCRGGFGAVFTAGALAVLLIAGQELIELVQYRYESRVYHIGRGADAFQDGGKAICASKVMALLSQRMKPAETLAVLPEGVMLNYLLRRRAPTPHINFMPIELMVYGEDRILDDFEANLPDFILVAHKNTAEYGLPFFGKDYGVRLFNWVKGNYTLLGRCGHPPLQNAHQFGIDIVERRDRRRGESAPGPGDA